MTVKECYINFGGDYDNVLRRLGKEELIKKILGMLLKDDNMQLLHSAISENDLDTAFRAAHTLKGIYMNLCLTPLICDMSELTELLRAHINNEEVKILFAKAEQSYKMTLKFISEFMES